MFSSKTEPGKGLVFLSLATVHSHIIDEQEAFIRQVTEIPLAKRKCRDLITLDILHLYCGGPEPTSVACKLNTYSRQRKYSLIFLSFLQILFCRHSF